MPPPARLWTCSTSRRRTRRRSSSIRPSVFSIASRSRSPKSGLREPRHIRVRHRRRPFGRRRLALIDRVCRQTYTYLSLTVPICLCRTTQNHFERQQGKKMKRVKLKPILLSTAAVIAMTATVTSTGSGAGNSPAGQLAPVGSLLDDVVSGKTPAATAGQLKAKTPIKHLVVVFNENRSFDHYFGTYPNAINPEGEPVFEPTKNTQRDINNLLTSPALLENNPNLNPANGTGASSPFRLDRTQANTADQNHGYTPEQLAFDGGKNDLFPLNTGNGTNGGAGAFGTKAQVMGYFDGNTVTAFWNYAQNYAMSDNSWSDTFGPSTPGAINMFA